MEKTSTVMPSNYQPYVDIGIGVISGLEISF